MHRSNKTKKTQNKKQHHQQQQPQQQPSLRPSNGLSRRISHLQSQLKRGYGNKSVGSAALPLDHHSPTTTTATPTSTSHQRTKVKKTSYVDDDRYYNPNDPKSKIRDKNGMIRLRPTSQNPAMLSEKSLSSHPDPLGALFSYGTSTMSSNGSIIDPVEWNRNKLRQLAEDENKRSVRSQGSRDFEPMIPMMGLTSSSSSSSSNGKTNHNASSSSSLNDTATATTTASSSLSTQNMEQSNNDMKSSVTHGRHNNDNNMTNASVARGHDEPRGGRAKTTHETTSRQRPQANDNEGQSIASSSSSSAAANLTRMMELNGQGKSTQNVKKTSTKSLSTKASDQGMTARTDNGDKSRHDEDQNSEQFKKPALKSTLTSVVEQHTEIPQKTAPASSRLSKLQKMQSPSSSLSSSGASSASSSPRKTSAASVSSSVSSSPIGTPSTTGLSQPKVGQTQVKQLANRPIDPMTASVLYTNTDPEGEVVDFDVLSEVASDHLEEFSVTTNPSPFSSGPAKKMFQRSFGGDSTSATMGNANSTNNRTSTSRNVRTTSASTERDGFAPSTTSSPSTKTTSNGRNKMPTSFADHFMRPATAAAVLHRAEDVVSDDNQNPNIRQSIKPATAATAAAATTTSATTASTKSRGNKKPTPSHDNFDTFHEQSLNHSNNNHNNKKSAEPTGRKSFRTAPVIDQNPEFHTVLQHLGNQSVSETIPVSHSNFDPHHNPIYTQKRRFARSVNEDDNTQRKKGTSPRTHHQDPKKVDNSGNKISKKPLVATMSSSPSISPSQKSSISHKDHIEFGGTNRNHEDSPKSHSSASFEQYEGNNFDSMGFSRMIDYIPYTQSSSKILPPTSRHGMTKGNFGIWKDQKEGGNVEMSSTRLSSSSAKTTSPSGASLSSKGSTTKSRSSNNVNNNDTKPVVTRRKFSTLNYPYHYNNNSTQITLNIPSRQFTSMNRYQRIEPSFYRQVKNAEANIRHERWEREHEDEIEAMDEALNATKPSFYTPKRSELRRLNKKSLADYEKNLPEVSKTPVMYTDPALISGVLQQNANSIYAPTSVTTTSTPYYEALNKQRQEQHLPSLNSPTNNINGGLSRQQKLHQRLYGNGNNNTVNDYNINGDLLPTNLGGRNQSSFDQFMQMGEAYGNGFAARTAYDKKDRQQQQKQQQQQQIVNSRSPSRTMTQPQSFTNNNIVNSMGRRVFSTMMSTPLDNTAKTSNRVDNKNNHNPRQSQHQPSPRIPHQLNFNKHLKAYNKGQMRAERELGQLNSSLLSARHEQEFNTHAASLNSTPFHTTPIHVFPDTHDERYTAKQSQATPPRNQSRRF